MANKISHQIFGQEQGESLEFFLPLIKKLLKGCSSLVLPIQVYVLSVHPISFVYIKPLNFIRHKTMYQNQNTIIDLII